MTDMDGTRNELRLAVVCYGGVSLCIYMHGITKELHRLVRASRLLSQQRDTSEAVYRDLLQAARPHPDVRREVVIDVIAGTSAGGINGVFLAKALARNLSQDALREIWLDKADIQRITRGPTRIPALARAPFLLGGLLSREPLRGREMACWLHDALAGMGAERPSEPDSLMLNDHELMLFVTMTDLHGHEQQVVIADPHEASEKGFRHAFCFRHTDRVDDFGARDQDGRDSDVALAFAARATSSFPGAFPPISVRELRSALPSTAGTIDPAHFRIYALAEEEVEARQFIDGGVLDNRPFDRVIDAIRKKSAEVEVDRRVIYIEPDPEGPSTKPASAARPLGTVLSALSAIPRKQPILDAITELNRLSERARRAQDIVIARFPEIRKLVEEKLRLTLDELSALDAREVSEWRETLNALARVEAGRTYPTYLRSKVGDVFDGVGQTCCTVCDYPEESNHAFMVRSALRTWADRQGFFTAAASDDQIGLVKDLDLDYAIRRLGFVIDGVNAWYACAGERFGDDPSKDMIPTRTQLDALKTILWGEVSRLRAARDGAGLGEEVGRIIRETFPETQLRRYIDEHGFDAAAYLNATGQPVTDLIATLREARSTEFATFSRDLYSRVARTTSEWSAGPRRDLLVRYLGFPLWDVVVHPVRSAENAGERDAVEIFRFSPRDARTLSEGDPEPKLAGAGFGHFRAFFKREYREHDYLWGRLDGAERIVDLILGEEHPDHDWWCQALFFAILDEESDLQTIGQLRAELRERAKKLSERAGPV